MEILMKCGNAKATIQYDTILYLNTQRKRAKNQAHKNTYVCD